MTDDGDVQRERREREKHGVIPGSLHAPYPDLTDNVRPGGLLHELGLATVLWCFLRNNVFVKNGVDYHLSADLTGQAAAEKPASQPASCCGNVSM